MANEVRVLEEVPTLLRPAALVDSDIMLNPWTELTLPSATLHVMATPGALPVEVPEMPAAETA